MAQAFCINLTVKVRNVNIKNNSLNANQSRYRHYLEKVNEGFLYCISTLHFDVS